MFEEDLEILDKQIARAKERLNGNIHTTEGAQLAYKIAIYEDMRRDLLIQIENAKEE